MYAMQGLTSLEAIAIWTVFGIAIIGLLYALVLRSQILREDKGTEKMQEVWGAIKDGADAYLKKQLRSILPLIIILTFALFLSVYIVAAVGGSLAGLQDIYARSGPPHHRCSTRRCLHHGSLLLAHRWTDRHAHGSAGQCPRGFGLPAFIR